MRISKKKWLWVCAALLCATLWYFAREKPQRFPGEGTIVEFVREGHGLSVFGGPLAKRTELVAMEQFEPFQPGLSPDDASGHYGQADRVTAAKNGKECAEYHNQYGRITLCEEETADGWVYHPLYFYPYDRRPEVFLRGAIISHLRSRPNEETVMFFECGVATPFMHAVITRGGLTEVVWEDSRDLRRRSDTSQCTEK